MSKPQSSQRSLMTIPMKARAFSVPPRFVTAASLFDGHDASINIMRRLLQAQGAEVIHLGHNRSAAEVVDAAIQEDADAIAISSYQGGHVEFFKYVIDLLKKNGAPHIRVFGGGGGTITPQEIHQLEKYGVSKIYSPEDGRALGLEGIIGDMLTRLDLPPFSHISWDKLNRFGESPLSLAQAITVIENEKWMEGEFEKERKQFWDLLNTKESKGVVVGMTGTGGAGKSSLTDEIILRLLASDPKCRIAVLAIDPTLRKSGGALLGDRLRMNTLQSPRCYMRSLATRENNAALSTATEKAISLLRRANFDWIFLESGGIGQADTSIVDIADIKIYVMTSEFGAPTQLEKINMLDYADIVVINKFDKGGSLDALHDVRRQLRRNRRQLEKLPPETYPVFGTVASRFNDTGVDAVCNHLKRVSMNDEKETFSSLPDPLTLPSTGISIIVPKERVHYLAEIAKTVRDYKKTAMNAVEKVCEMEAVSTTLKNELSSSTKKELEETLAKTKQSIDRDLLDQIQKYPDLEKEYAGDSFTFGVRDRQLSVPLTYESLSHTKIKKVSLPHFRSQADLMRFLLLENLPGHFPFTGGVFPLKRTEEDPKRQFAGEGTPSRTNERFHFLCNGEKAKRLSTAFDSVTLYGEDPSERPDIYGKIGESGVSVATLDDAKKLYSGFDLCDPNTSVSMTINGPAPMLLAFFFNTAIDQKVEAFKKENGRLPSATEEKEIEETTLRTVRGTVQADILKEDQAQNTCIFSTDFALRMMGDIQSYFIDHEIRNYYSVSISGYHIAEAGANPITQLAFTLANGFTYVEYYRSRGMDIDAFCPNFSFFFSNGLDPEYTVIGRVARRIWAIAMRDLYKGSERSQKLKYHIQTSGRSLHAQEMSFNDIRTTLQALIAFFDHCNSLHTNAYDEALTTPTAESVRRAMAIQLVIAKEFGWAKNENPLQGSFFIEELTDLVEEAVLSEFERISARGGVLGAMETLYQRSQIQEESLYYERKKHSGELPIVGVNTFLNPDKPREISPGNLTRASYDEKNEQIKNLKAFQEKHSKQSSDALARLKKTASEGGNLFAELMKAARVCSLGQMTHALYEVGGQYRRGV